MLLDTTHTVTPVSQSPFTDDVIRRRIDSCPKLGSLQSINRALSDLVNSEQSLNSQIAEIHHEVHYNNGSSVKDAVTRVEQKVDGLIVIEEEKQ